ncbi:MAG: dual specificity protein phosphatase family protein [Burkholderiales bacterium]|nr:dual specificity protein phosphatase family protein [Burkholderiales bacterium]MBI3729273.1 dual specificity protein phosphatase family protein [Burkholderiales bacterium]
MRPDIYKVTQIGQGFLAVMAKPIAGEWIEDEFRGIAQFGISRLVSLLETHEIRDLGLQAAPDLCAANQINFMHYPIKDRGLPSSFSATQKVVTQLHDAISSGDNTVIHCRAGIGRTGLLAAAVLIRHGFDAAAALAMISKARGVTVPDTEEQIDWLNEHQAALRT